MRNPLKYTIVFLIYNLNDILHHTYKSIFPSINVYEDLLFVCHY